MISFITNNDPWDPTSFRLDEALVGRIVSAPSVRKRRMVRRVSGLFLRGPVPMQWLGDASKLGVSALWVGCVLWHLAGLKRSDTFLVSNLHMHRWGVNRYAKSRALIALERAHLIAVKNRGKRSPKVTILVEEKHSHEGWLDLL